MASFSKGTTYATNDTVTATNLNALVDNAVPLPGIIEDRTQPASPAASDKYLVYQSGALNKITWQQMCASPQPIGGTNASSIKGTDITATGTLNVSGVSSFNSAVNINGATTVTGDLTVTGSINGGGGGGGGTYQAVIQFKDDGSNLGSTGTVTSVNFTGTGVTASRDGANAVTVNVPGVVGDSIMSRLTGDLTYSSTSESDVTGLTISAGAAETWTYEYYLWGYSLSAGQNYTFTVKTVSGLSVASGFRMINYCDSSLFVKGVAATGLGLFDIPVVGIVSTPIVIKGSFTTGASSEVIKMTIKQTASGSNSLTVKAGSFLRAVKIA